MLKWIAIILLVLWVIGFVALQITDWTIHVLLVVAIILFFIRFISGR